MRESTAAHWDRYWRERENIDEVYSNEQRVLSQVGDLELAGRRVLEVGAGSGRDSIELARSGAVVFLLDYVASSFTVVRTVAKEAGQTVFCVCGDATRMPFRDGAFRLVFHQGLMEHFRDPRPLLSENLRATEPGGYCLIDVPQRYHPYTLAKHAMIAMNRWFAGWETEFSPGSLSRVVREAGFGVVRIGGDWMVPGFWYRSLRYGLMRARVARLPKYPPGIPGLSALQRRAREWLRRRRVGPYTFAMVSVLARRPLVDGARVEDARGEGTRGDGARDEGARKGR
ncbi:MAG: class I SAM-dependent methyltransferase [Candidatus Eisenbacteria bacterium]|nr:class I SAM-dependent methyltransferase [Candidatus Eisenbacteria bacterium]